MHKWGHLEAMLQVIAYLQQKSKSRLTYDPIYTDFITAISRWANGQDFLGLLSSQILLDAPEEKGKEDDCS